MTVKLYDRGRIYLKYVPRDRNGQIINLHGNPLNAPINTFLDLHSQYGEYVTSTRCHKVLNSLRKNPRQLRLLILDYDLCTECKPRDGLVSTPQPCRVFSRALLRRFPNLETLVFLGKYDCFVDDNIRKLPSLRELGLGQLVPDARQSSNILYLRTGREIDGEEPDGHLGYNFLELPNLIHTLRPGLNLDKLRIFDTSIDYAEDPPPEFPELENSNLENLEMSNVGMFNTETEFVLFTMCFPSLRRFAFSRGCNSMPDTTSRTPYIWRGNIELSSLDECLEYMEATVESLELDYSCRHRMQNEVEPLGPLILFRRLRNLTIDPTMLQGRLDCSGNGGAARYPANLPQGTFGEKMPASLEKLNLIIDAEQVQKDPHWERFLLRGILVEMTRLTNLRTINYMPVRAASSLVRSGNAEPYVPYTFPTNIPNSIYAFRNRFLQHGVTLNFIDEQTYLDGAWRQWP
ncbi:hypothetical protein H2200_012414 [Cladophialophora chaetospira]|uniref:Uncharacterized protein n=1 Tax=Cladophialophora chaetospira TaxID=386627 RepID=A0AA38WXT6_9EURO|nr:hypothetical protein H2200_012414 [Cladophialophora chaetospira]